jgi:hypothetical protein
MNGELDPAGTDEPLGPVEELTETLHSWVNRGFGRRPTRRAAAFRIPRGHSALVGEYLAAGSGTGGRGYRCAGARKPDLTMRSASS